MAADLFVFQVHEISKSADLKTVPCGNHHFMAPLPKLIDDWLEKRHVRRIIQVDPDFLPFAFRCVFACHPCHPMCLKQKFPNIR